MLRRFPKLVLALVAVAALTTPSPQTAAPPERAPEFRKAEWINSTPLSLKALKGKVVLLDFWAFDCEPCLKTLPYVKTLHEKYATSGFVVIGIHTPRTSDERNVSKLKAAVTRLGITYPVAVDGEEKMWQDYRCDLWPTQFVIDRDGNIRLVRGGVGRQAEIEQTIQQLLAEKP